MSDAEQILLTGSNQIGSTKAILHSDMIGEMIKEACKNIKFYGLVPVDGIHSDQPLGWNPSVHIWEGWLQYNLKISGSIKNLNKDCLNDQKGKEWSCYLPENVLK